MKKDLDLGLAQMLKKEYYQKMSFYGKNLMFNKFLSLNTTTNSKLIKLK